MTTWPTPAERCARPHRGTTSSFADPATHSSTAPALQAHACCWGRLSIDFLADGGFLEHIGVGGRHPDDARLGLSDRLETQRSRAIEACEPVPDGLARGHQHVDHAL